MGRHKLPQLGQHFVPGPGGHTAPNFGAAVVLCHHQIGVLFVVVEKDRHRSTVRQPPTGDYEFRFRS